MQQFTSRKQLVGRPVGARYKDRYTIQTMKHFPRVLVWGAMSVHGEASLDFPPARYHNEWRKIPRSSEG